MITNNRLLKLSSFALLALLAPTLVFAAPLRTLKPTAGNATGTANNLKPTAAAAVCARIDAFMEKLQAGLGQANTNLAQVRTERSYNLQNRAEQNDEKLNKIRDTAETNREQFYEKLQARATSDGQKQAVETFRNTVEAAVQVRRTAVDAAIEAFRQGLKEAVQTRQETTERTRTAFQTAVQAAEAEAKANCGTLDAQTVRTQLLSDLQKARTQLRANIKVANQVQTTLQQLKQTRRQAIKKAIDTFHAAFQAALSDLKAAFPNTTPGTSTENGK
ncbi:MAG: hypothetical protein M1275_01070 [Patescibacteria group bacterium]|nr:hypothetical protein [Patescibacteria group bacterium]